MSWKFNPFTQNLDYYHGKFVIVPHSADTILTLADLGKVHIMDVSGGNRTFTLPSVGASNIGQWVILVRSGTANFLQIYADTGEYILNSSAGGYMECADAGHDYSSVQLFVLAAGQWGVPVFGIWSTY